MLLCISKAMLLPAAVIFIASVSGTVSLLPVKPQLLQWDFRRIAAFI